MDKDYPTHAAFVYRSDDAYFDYVVTFLTAARPDERIVLVPMSRRWPELAARLTLGGLDWQRAVERDEMRVVAAESLLDEVVLGGTFSRRRFDAAATRILNGDGSYRFYGDAASLLVARNNLGAAVALEHAWTEVARERPLHCTCGYDLRFFPEEHEWPVRSIINGHRRASAQPGIPTAHLVSARRHRREGDPPLVLLWDDHRDTRDMYAEALTFDGYRVIVADDAAEMIALAHAYRPGLILMDVRLAERRAADAMRTLRTRHEFTAPILALTAHAFDAEREKIVGAGFDEVLSKPCLPDELLAHVTGALQARH